MARKLRFIISFSFLLLGVLVFSSTCYAKETLIKFYTGPEDNVTQGQTLKITGSVSAPVSKGCEVYVVIKRNSSSRWIEVEVIVDESLTQGETKNYDLFWSVPSNAELGKYGVYAKTVVGGKRDSWSYPEFNVVKGNESSPQPTCEAKFIGEKYCKSGAIYQKYRQNNCSQSEKKIKTCDFGCDGGVCKNSTNSTDKTIISNATTSNSTTTNYSANSTTNNTNNTLASNNTNSNNQTSNNRTTNASEQHLTEQKTTQEAPLPLDQPTESDKPLVDSHQISALFLLEKNLSLIGLIVLLAVVGVILWKI